jgi:phosphatidylserine decarboxylase
MEHQYIERETLNVRTEHLYWDKVVTFLYSRVREDAPRLFRMLTGPRLTDILGFVNYDLFLGRKLSGNKAFMKRCGIDLAECIDPTKNLDTPKKIFERKIRYWECRPMSENQAAIVSPADARILIGSFCEDKPLYVKEKFFQYEQLLGKDRSEWLRAFRGGHFAIFRLTPDKYHYNHTPVSGKVVDIYTISGRYHSCNPNAVITTVTPYSLNKRVVTIIDTDVEGGTKAGLVAMIEVVAFMIGDIVQCYSDEEYRHPQSVIPGMFIKKGAPKSLYRPGSSTDILIFQKDRIVFADDLLMNLNDRRALSRYSLGFGDGFVETDVKVRSFIGMAIR